MLTAEQLRAARAMVRMDQSSLAKAASISIQTVKRLEGFVGELASTKAGTLQALQRALETAGVEFIAGNGSGPGVRLRKGTIEKTSAMGNE